jgi:hypothetical protein
MWRLAVLLLATAALAGCGGDQSPAPQAAPADGIRELSNVLGLRSDFEANADKTRVIVLFSPT